MPVAKCTGEKFVMPLSIAVGNEAFADYLKVASLPVKERRQLFSKQTNEQKASFIKVNLASQLVKRPEMTKEQQEFVLDTISKVSADLYDNSTSEKARRSEQIGLDMENKALGLFSPKDLADFIEPLMTNKDESVAFLNKYTEINQFSIGKRKQLVRDLSPAERSNFWKTQLAYHISTSKLTKTQTSFLGRLFVLMTPDAFNFPIAEGQEKNQFTLLLDSETLKGVELFSKEEFFAIFMGYGVHITETEKSIEASDFQGTCDCNNYCGIYTSCSGTAVCARTRDGCGVFGGSSCRFICKSF